MAKRSFGYIRQLPSGRYQASYTDHGGQRRTAPDTFATRAEADAWLGRTRTMINSNERIDQETALKTFDIYAVGWLMDKRETIRPKTAQLYAGIIDQHLTPYLGAYALKDITPGVVKEWRRWLLGRFRARVEAGDVPRRDTTGQTRTAQAYRLLHAIMATAVRDQAITINPCNIVGAGVDHAEERKPATMEELAAITANMPDRYKALVYVAAWSGLRFSELAGLTRGDVVTVPGDDGAAGYMLIVDKQTYRLGAELHEKEPTKTAAGKRKVYVFEPSAVAALKWHMERFTEPSFDAYVFTSGNGTPISSNVVGKKFRTARKAAGRDDLRFHDLRHTCATLLAENGATTKQLMQFMGHSSSRAALIYQHATDSSIKQLAENVARAPEVVRTREEVLAGLRVREGGKQRTAPQRNTVSTVGRLTA